MNTLYVLKGGMKFKFLALTVVVLLGLGVGNTAWGQCSAKPSGGNWGDLSTWECGHLPYNYEPVVIPPGVTVTLQSTVAWGGSQPVTVNGTLDLNGYSFSNGTDIIVNGSVLGNGSLSTGYGAITVGADGQINIGGDLVSGGNLTFGNNSSVAIGGNMNMTNGGATLSIGDNVILNIGGNAILKACTISATTEMRVKGSVTHSSGVLNIYGKLIVNSNFESTNGNGLNIYTGGELVIKGYANFEHIGTLALSGGNLLISGDLSYDNGNALVVNSPSFVAVGGDFDLSETMTVGAGAQLIVLGDLSADNQITINGDMSVVGQYDVPGWIVNACTECSGGVITDDCCNISSIIGDIPSSHPIWNVIEGINSIYFEGFDSETDGELVYDYSGETDRLIWSSDNIQARCNDHIKASAYIWLVGSGTIHFEYSLTDADVNSVTGWNAIGVENTTTRRYGLPSIAGTQIKLRIRATGLNTGSKVTMDNILVQATNEGGIPADPVVWIDEHLIETVLCPPDVASYAIDNDNGGAPRYTSIVWSITKGAGDITVDPTNDAACTVNWTGLDGELSVTVEGGTCGGATTELTRVIGITKSPNIVLHYTASNVTCYDKEDGQITLEGVCGPDNGEVMVYEWLSVPPGETNPDEANLGTVSSASGLRPGDYVVKVSKGTGQEDTKTITITQPDELKVGLDNLTNFLCTPNTGSFTVVPTGGTSPYTVAVNGTPYSDPVDWAFTNLSNGTYNIVVTDANDCSTNETVEIQDDVEDPYFVNFPADVQLTTLEYNTTYNEGNKTDQTLTIGSTPNSSYTTSGVFDLPVNLMKYRNGKVSFNVIQNGTPTNSDILKVEVSTDGGSNFGTPLLEDNNTLETSSVNLDFGDGASRNKNVVVRLTFSIVTPDVSYNVSDFKIIADEQVHDFLVETPGCDDNSGSCTVRPYVDSDPIWSNCTDYDDGEFRIERTWTTSDACRSVSRIQYLSVGEAPEFDNFSLPADLDVDFCENSPAIQPPTAIDACGDVTISYEVRDSVDAVILNGVVTDPAENVVLDDLPADPYGNNTWEYRVTWIATDKAHNKKTHNQTIRVAPQIAANYEYSITDPDLDVCLDKDVTITIKPRGGVAPYSYGDFAPDVIDPSFAPVVTTNQLTTADPALKFRITDSKSCWKDLQTPDFKVHQLVKTETISRD